MSVMIRKEIKSEVIIHATPKIVWEHLINFEKYKEWNPFILSIGGSLAKSAKMEVEIKPPNAKPMKFRPTIITVDEGKEIRWIGRLFIKGLFDGEHYFKLVKEGDTTRFIQGEIFSGILVPFMKTMIERNTLAGFQEMNLKLKKRVELSVCE
ncbi:MAG TPA: SRPBCC domain-containing protein [Porphyromonadaceae bacterium]|nr:SRPBCC domain-containing protein [Porphyromonadaceae bacterium]